MIWDSANCYFHNFLMDPCSLLVSKLSHRPRPSLPLPTPLPLSLSQMSESAPTEQKEQDLEVDWTALKFAVDEMSSALALVRANSATRLGYT